MKYELYVNKIENLIPYEGSDLNSLDIKCTRVTHGITSIINAIFWNIITCGRVKAYVVYDEKKIVHKSFVVRGKTKFRFLGKKDIEIGPCWTHSDYRGRGIYPTVLTRIIRQELSGGGIAYMVIQDTNLSSQQGVLKVGFSKNNQNVKIDALKRYTIE